MNLNASFLVAALCSTLAVSLHAEPTVRIIQPYENQTLPPVPSSFVFGSIQPATATLTINGIAVTPHTNGGFLVMVPFKEGPNKIEAVVSDGVSMSTATRMVHVEPALRSYPADFGKIIPLYPKYRLVLRPEDHIRASFQGAPGGEASFKIGGRGDSFPMLETGKSGIYEGVYKIQPTDKFDEDDIVFFLERADKKKLTQKAGAEITIQRRSVPRFVEVKDRSILYTGPGSDFGYDILLQPGIVLEVTGEWGDFLRVPLGRRDEGWVKKSALKDLPAGTAPPRSISRNVRVDASVSSTTIEIPLQHRHPFRIEQSVNPHRLKLTIYGVVADTDRIRYRSPRTIVREMNWSQSDADTYTLNIDTKQKLAWGYDARYEGTKLILEIRHQPSAAVAARATPLKGIKVALDAGHSTQSFGTIGPWGNTEAQVNLAVANVVRKELEKRGADVIMIQDGTRDPSLQERVDWAWNGRAQLFISIHCDATSEGTDPREIEGYSVHYYHPQSRAFAEEVHANYGKRSNIRDQGLWRSNLAVARATQFPSILFELAFLILPEFEERLITPSFHQIVADTIVASITNLLSKSDQ
jgi:N-acetylmuramoyl-L-alanine amidase